jgi:hypothetical protein
MPSISASAPVAAIRSRSSSPPASSRAGSGAQRDYAYGQPYLTAKKLRRLEITAGTPRYSHSGGVWGANVAMRQAENAYAQTVRDRRAAGIMKAAASATPGRASRSTLWAQPRGRPQAPDVCASLRQSLAPTRTISQEAAASTPHVIFSVQEFPASRRSA